jgi:hypothetical protein
MPRYSYFNSCSPTLNASASLRMVRGEAIRYSSSKSEIESAETPLLAESCRTVTPRSLRTLFRLCSSGMDWRRQGGLYTPTSPSLFMAEHTSYTQGVVVAPLTALRPTLGLLRIPLPRTPRVNSPQSGLADQGLHSGSVESRPGRRT